MNKKEILESISSKGNGEIYLGVVGAVRTGKSTFIKKVIESLIVPNIEDEIERKRCLDEIPQTAQGKQIMTIEPKFVPSSGAKIKIDEFTCNMKLIDCVGFVTPEATGYMDETGTERDSPGTSSARTSGASSASALTRATISSRAARDASVMFCRTGSAKAQVLPVPVCAEATTSRPERMSGIASACTGVGVVKPRASTPASTW